MSAETSFPHPGIGPIVSESFFSTLLSQVPVKERPLLCSRADLTEIMRHDKIVSQTMHSPILFHTVQWG
jgi:hypothetical protein